MLKRINKTILGTLQGSGHFGGCHTLSKIRRKAFPNPKWSAKVASGLFPRAHHQFFEILLPALDPGSVMLFGNAD